MYTQLNSQMIQAHQAEANRGNLQASHRRELREHRSPRRGKPIRRVAAVAAALILVGGTSDALAATSVHRDSNLRVRAGHTMRTSRAAVRVRFFRRA